MKRLAGLCAVMALVSSGLAQAESPPPFEDFTFKMGKPPEKGARKRITVQIDSAEQAARLAVPAKSDAQESSPAREGAVVVAPSPVLSSYAWFWELVPHGLGESPAVRFQKAMDQVSRPPAGKSLAGPRLQDLQTIANAHGAEILMATIGTQISPALALAVIAVESGGRQDAESGAGAQGLMQLMPATADRFGVTDAFDPRANIKGGVRYLDWLMTEFDGDAVLALAGYNAGENAVKSHKGIPPFAETRDYVPKVLAAFNVAKGLCKTQPELVSDGCALNFAMK